MEIVLIPFILLVASVTLENYAWELIHRLKLYLFQENNKLLIFIPVPKFQPAFLCFASYGTILLLMELSIQQCTSSQNEVYLSLFHQGEKYIKRQISCSMNFPSPYLKFASEMNSFYPLQADLLALSQCFWNCCGSLWCFFSHLEVPQSFPLYLKVRLWSFPHKISSSANAAGSCCDYLWIHSLPHGGCS